MTDRITKLFYELIHVSLGHQIQLSSVPSPEEWEELFFLSQKQALGGVLFSGLEHLPLEQRPPKPVLLNWFMLKEQIQQLNRKINQQAVEATRYFKEHGFDNCIMKGQGIGAYYPDPLLRNPGDIDIWLADTRENVYKFAASTDNMHGLTYAHIHYHLFDDTEVEAHVTPSWLSSPFKNIRLQRFFRECWKTEFDHPIELVNAEGTINIPSDEFNRFYQLLHIYHHLFGEGIGLRQMMDYYYLLKQEASQDSLQRTRDLLASYGLTKFAGAMMYVLREVFGLSEDKLYVSVNEKEGKFLLKEIMLAGNFGQYDLRINRKLYHSTWRRFLLSVKRNLKFLSSYPSEILWDPIFRIWLYVWRLTIKY